MVGEVSIDINAEARMPGFSVNILVPVGGPRADPGGNVARPLRGVYGSKITKARSEVQGVWIRYRY